MAAWAVNQLARGNKADVRKLVRAGERLRKAQAEALSGSSARLRDAQADERDAIRALTSQARQLVDSDATVERVAATLRAAAVDPDALRLVQAGRLTEEVEPSGFGALAGMAVAKPPRRDEAPERKRRDRLAKARERAEELEREAAAAEAEAGRAEEAAKKARDDAERARARADAAAQKLAEEE